MISRLGFLLVPCCLTASGCDSKLCTAADDGEAPSHYSEVLSGSLRMADMAERVQLDYRATLRGLPELWNKYTLEEGWFSFELSLAYETAPFGGDGATEMPVFTIELLPEDQGDPEPIHDTPKAPLNPTLFGRALFRECALDRDPYCCRFAARECSLPVSVRIERGLGESSPPVVLDWKASLSARVNSCAEPNEAEALLELEPP